MRGGQSPAGVSPRQARSAGRVGSTAEAKPAGGGGYRGDGDQSPYSPDRHASNRVKPYLLFPWAAELVHHSRIPAVWRDH
jgi:hypothetical protein